MVAFSAGDAIVLVDSGAPKSGDKVVAALKAMSASGKVQTLFNTHYHIDQTGNNEMFAAQGARIIAHDRTRAWMSTDYWVPAENRYEKARPKAARPTETFQTSGSLKTGGEQIDYGYLTLAHTNGDIYVYFKTSNVLAVGDVASPLRDPALDYFTGAWIGGRVDAMDDLLKLANDQTKNRARVWSGDDQSRIQSGTRPDGRGSRAAFQTGSGRRWSEGHVGGRRFEGSPPDLERPGEISV